MAKLNRIEILTQLSNISDKHLCLLVGLKNETKAPVFRAFFKNWMNDKIFFSSLGEALKAFTAEYLEKRKTRKL